MYTLVMSHDTIIVLCGTFVFSTKLMKSFVSLRYDFCDFAIGWRM